MKKILKLVALIAILLPLALPLYGQANKKKKKKDETEFIDKLWVGGAINNNLRFGGGYFAFGLTPMVGYELVPNVSIGPFVRLDYHYERLAGPRPYYRYEAFDIGPGVFARVDVFKNFFGQIEFEHAYVKIPLENCSGVDCYDSNRKAKTETEVQNYVYIGAGYATGENVRYGVSIHYNVLDDFNYIRIPWDYRITLRIQL